MNTRSQTGDQTNIPAQDSDSKKTDSEESTKKMDEAVAPIEAKAGDVDDSKKETKKEASALLADAPSPEGSPMLHSLSYSPSLAGSPPSIVSTSTGAEAILGASGAASAPPNNMTAILAFTPPSATEHEMQLHRGHIAKAKSEGEDSTIPLRVLENALAKNTVLADKYRRDRRNLLRLKGNDNNNLCEELLKQSESVANISDAWMDLDKELLYLREILLKHAKCVAYTSDVWMELGEKLEEAQFVPIVVDNVSCFASLTGPLSKLQDGDKYSGSKYVFNIKYEDQTLESIPIEEFTGNANKGIRPMY